MAKIATKTAPAPRASILDRLRTAPADKLPVKPVEEIEESDRLLAQLRSDLQRTADEAGKIERAKRDVPPALAANYSKLRKLVSDQEQANGLLRARVDQKHFDKLAPRWHELQRERIACVEAMRKINEQLNAISEQCSAAPSMPLRDWNSMLFFRDQRTARRRRSALQQFFEPSAQGRERRRFYSAWARARTPTKRNVRTLWLWQDCERDHDDETRACRRDRRGRGLCRRLDRDGARDRKH
jgi:hypothetical protein